jgi:hypothetical protein
MAMNLTRQDQLTEFIIGAEGVCDDGAPGELRRLRNPLG